MKLLKLLTWAKHYSVQENTMYYVVRKLDGTLGIYNILNRPKHCKVLYNVSNNDVYKRREWEQ